MRVEPIFEPDGSITVPGGATYVRASERVRRKTGAQYVADGAVVVTEMYGEDTLVHTGLDAVDAWAQILPRLDARVRKPTDYPIWSGKVYVSESGLVLLFMEGRH